jgi:hypothetical protein
MFFLIEDGILPNPLPFPLAFKHNESPHTASLVGYLSAEEQQQELEYWIEYMGEDIRGLVFISIPEDEYSH